MGARLRAVLSLLLWPASELIGRLRYAQKFLLVGLVLLAPLVVTVNSYVSVQRAQIEATVREQQGLRYLRTLLVLDGDLVQARRSAVSAGFDLSVNLDADLVRVDEIDRQTTGSWQVHPEWTRTRESIVTALQTTEEAKSVKFEKYQMASDSILALIVTLGDRSGLIHDPDLDSNYIARMLQDWLPSLCDVSGRIADLLEVTGQEQGSELKVFIELGKYFGVLSASSQHMTRAADAVAASAGDDEVITSILSQSRELKAVTAAMGERLAFAVDHRSLQQFPSHSADAVRVATNGYASVAVTSLDKLLKARIERSTERIYRVRLWLGLASLLAVYLFAGFYFSVTRPVRRIVEVLRAVAGGDLTSRVEVSTKDELSFIADALNETITTTEAATGRLARLATSDSLTSLPNRAAVIERLEQALLRVKQRSDLLAVLFIDLDRFKLVNDSLGHDAGDAVLRAVAERLTSGMRATTDTVARLAGDEFVVISEDVREVGAAVAAAERVVADISQPIRVAISGGYRDITIGASIGIAFVTPGSPVSASDLLRDADVAMYQAKQRGRGRVEIFDESLSSALEHRVRTEQDLRQAIQDDELVVFYQPIVEAGTGRTAGFEALARWQHPTRGLLSPDQFIPVAEESGLIVPLGAAVLMQACRQLAVWQRERPDGDRLRMSVNVSALQFDHPSFVPTVATVLETTGIDPATLWLEITETSLAADIAQATVAFEALRSLGVRLALDDFGTGYSSLAHLQKFPVQALKIDRSFVDGIEHDPEAGTIVEMIIGVANTLGLLVIAEGVENQAQADELHRLGCTLFQGYHFSRPAPAEMQWQQSDPRVGAV